MTGAELLTLVTCDLGAIVRGRSILSAELAEHLAGGIGWVPANLALTPLGELAEPNPFGSMGDLRLLPDPDAHVRVGAEREGTPLELVLCDIVELDGRPWDCCPRSFLRGALEALRRATGAAVRASFEHEFQLLGAERCGLAFSLESQRLAEPFANALMGALVEAGAEPERIFPEFASHQFEVPVAPAGGLAAADRAVFLREVVREVARRCGRRATFVPLLDAAEAGNGVHIHLSLSDEAGRPLLYDPDGPGGLSEIGGRFAAGVLAHAGALSALCAPSPVSGERLRPHHWSAGAACLAARNREALLRIPGIATLGGAEPAGQMRLEYRGADAAANPHLALGAIVYAGLAGIREQLPAPPLLERDPAELDEREAARFGVGALPSSLLEALDALTQDTAAAGWFPPLLLDAYLALKRSELAGSSELSLQEACRRYGEIY
ncbi:MAG: glutamine synthetase family protein [Solirubrobacteraceae bacterium]